MAMNPWYIGGALLFGLVVFPSKGSASSTPDWTAPGGTDSGSGSDSGGSSGGSSTSRRVLAIQRTANAILLLNPILFDRLDEDGILGPKTEGAVEALIYAEEATSRGEGTDTFMGAIVGGTPHASAMASSGSSPESTEITYMIKAVMVLAQVLGLGTQARAYWTDGGFSDTYGSFPGPYSSDAGFREQWEALSRS